MEQNKIAALEFFADCTGAEFACQDTDGNAELLFSFPKQDIQFIQATELKVVLNLESVKTLVSGLQRYIDNNS